MVSRTGPGLSDTLTYDGAGRIVDASQPDGLVHHVYDGLGRVDTVTWPGGRTVGHEYDGASNLTGLTYPDGSKVRPLQKALSGPISLSSLNRNPRNTQEYSCGYDSALSATSGHI